VDDNTQVREHPTLFSTPMVQATLARHKTQTRRVVSVGNSLVNGSPPCKSRNKDILSAWYNLDLSDAFVDTGPSPAGNPGPYLQVAGGDETRHRVYPRVQPGDRLWVRETWVKADGLVTFRADGDWIAHMREEPQAAAAAKRVRWQSGRFLRRSDCRIQLEITEVRVERLQEITEQDARAEGAIAAIAQLDGRANDLAEEAWCRWTKRIDTHARSATGRGAFASLWEKINSHRDGCAWNDNPWVWIYVFRKLGAL
jgi:hypothetical protein